MSDDLHSRLQLLAEEAVIGPVDLAAITRAGTVRRRRPRTVVLAPALALVLAVPAALAVRQAVPGPDRLTPATPVPSPARQSLPAAPSEGRLMQLLGERLGVAGDAQVITEPAGPLGPDKSAFGGVGRVMVADGLFTLYMRTAPPVRTVNAHWYAVSPPLSHDEAQALSRGVHRYGSMPGQTATPMVGNPGGRVDGLHSAVHFLNATGDEPNPTGGFEGHLLALAWGDRGGIVQLRMSGNANDDVLAQRLDQAAQDLLGQDR